jgi:hypothetical protein
MGGSRSRTAVPETLCAGRSKVEGWGWLAASIDGAPDAPERWRARVRHRCRAATGLTLRDGLIFVETTIRLLLVNRIRSRPDGAGQAGPASRGGRPGIAEWMFPGLLVAKATASLGHVDGHVPGDRDWHAPAPMGLGWMAGWASREGGLEPIPVGGMLVGRK